MDLTTDDTHWGYVAYGNEATDPENSKDGDTKEGFYIAQSEAVSSRSNHWPTIPEWKENVQKYMDKMEELSIELAQLIALSLNLTSDYFETPGMRNEGQDILYMLHYPPMKSDPDRGVLGNGAHTDYDLFTILLTDSNPGLQIWYQGEWMDVEYRENAFIVNIADTLQLWSNGMFKSARHRAVLNGENHRYSIPFFVGANRELKIDCLPNTVVEGHPIFGQCNHETFTYGEYLEYKLQATHSDYGDESDQVQEEGESNPSKQCTEKIETCSADGI